MNNESHRNRAPARTEAHNKVSASQTAREIPEREQELATYRQLLEMQEREFEAYRARLHSEHVARERSLQQQLEDRDKLLAEREDRLLQRQREFERQLMRREAESEALRSHFQEQILAREAELQQAQVQLQQEKERYTAESRKKLEQTSKDYVLEALEVLQGKEREFHTISKIWSAVGALALTTGLGFFGYVTLASFPAVGGDVTWQFIVFSVTKGVIAIALLAGLSKYAYEFSSSYMREALKNADRRHAINFGKFYLETYGASANWAEVKEAFEHWNITGFDTFSHRDATSSAPDNGSALAVLSRARKKGSTRVPPENVESK